MTISIKSVFAQKPAGLSNQLVSIVCWLSLLLFPLTTKAENIRVAVFQIDATPPIGSPVAYSKTRSVTDPLSVRGIVILSRQQPIVLCTVDWIGIGNEGQDVWRQKLAQAASTSVDRVSIHALHQHDGPRCDFTVEQIMEQYGLGGTSIDNAFVMKVITNSAAALTESIRNAQTVTHLGFGQAIVDSVASNRRILGENGKVAITRWSATTDSVQIAAPQGLIDPWLRSVSLWNGKKPLAVLSYYTTHPQSFYGQGDVTCEFIGLARNARERQLGVPHIHFNGASGNITAGKYNDGSQASRQVLTRRIEKAMTTAWESTVRSRISGKDVEWKFVKTQLPLSKNLTESSMRDELSNAQLSLPIRYRAAEKLAWYQRTIAGNPVRISALRIGKTWLLNLPGEPFVEYQLAAQKMLGPRNHVCTAAYEEYGPGYIGTRISYEQGGYETSGNVSGCAPEVEQVLLSAIRSVLSN